jgi:signal transduction histidine kinase
MVEIYQDILKLLTESPGNLAYHLVLAFSIAGALQAALHLWRDNQFPQGRRMVLGLSLLLITQLILFAAAGLSGEGLFTPHSLLPVIDRGITNLGLILIIWLWVFPEPQRMADAATGLLTLLTITISSLSLILWMGNNTGTFFNQTWLDIAWELYALGLLALGLVLLLLRRPNGWGYGLAMLIISIVGHLGHLVSPLPESDFPGLVRLTQMAAYPLLLALPQRFQALDLAASPQIPKQESIIQDRPRYSIEPKILRAILSLGTERSFQKICQTLTEIIAEIMVADICLTLLPPDNNGQIMIHCGYDLIRQEPVGGISIESRDIPLLASAMQRTHPLRLPASSTSKDLFNLGQLLSLGRTGHLLAAFVPKTEDTPLIGIVLLSPYSNRGWSNEDQIYLAGIADSLAQILQRSREWNSIQDELSKTKQNLQAFQTLLEETQNENAGLRTELSNVSKKAIDEQKDGWAALAVVQQESEETIARLEAENLRLEDLVESMLSEIKPSGKDLTHIEDELKLSLEEVARLQKQLSEADQKILELQKATSTPSTLNDEQLEIFASIAQELRQPMSSIIGYTDLLLGESVGILGALQRKFLERINASTDRMGALLEDLFQIASLDGEPLALNPEPIDLGNVIDEAISAASGQFRDRNIALRVDLPQELPLVHADGDALQQVLIHLLKNAGAASPIEGEILLRASTHTNEDQEDYVLFQIADQGGGIPAEDLPRVFSRLYRADNPLIEGIGDTGVGLSIAKTLVEAHDGRIWVDTEMGKGSTFSVLIPVSNHFLAEEGQGGSSE